MSEERLRSMAHSSLYDLTLRRLINWRLLSDGGETLFDVLLSKMWENKYTFSYLNKVDIPKSLKFRANLTVKGLLQIKRNRKDKVIIVKANGLTTYTAFLVIPNVDIHFDCPVKVGCYTFNISGKIEIESLKLFMELSVKDGKFMLEFVKTESPEEFVVNFQESHRFLRRIFRSRVLNILEEVDISVGHATDYFIAKAANRILATDELFQ